MVPINILNFVFSPYKIKSHFVVHMTFSFTILGTKNVDRIFLYGLKILMKFLQRLNILTENFTKTKKYDIILQGLSMEF